MYSLLLDYTTPLQHTLLMFLSFLSSHFSTRSRSLPVKFNFGTSTLEKSSPTFQFERRWKTQITKDRSVPGGRVMRYDGIQSELLIMGIGWPWQSTNGCKVLCESGNQNQQNCGKELARNTFRMMRA